jgi:DNA-binding SARP family transcriptional activator
VVLSVEIGSMNQAALFVRLLGPPAVTRGGAEVALPRSRKVRALLAFLALAPTAYSRSRLCGLLWDVPNDPRGELRWCLSKLRGLLDDSERARVVTRGDLVSLDLSDCRVDAVELEQAERAGFELPSERLAELCELVRGELLDGVDLDGSPEFGAWLAAERQRYRSLHVAALEALAARVRGTDAVFKCLERWLLLAPFDQRAHELMLSSLLRSGRHQDAEEYLARAIRAYQREQLDWSPLRDAWQHMQTDTQRSPRVETVAVREEAPRPRAAGRRASLAVTPFLDRSPDGAQPSRVADGLTEDIIIELAKLRVLFVIARGSVYTLAERGIGPEETARILDVDYLVSGTVRQHGGGHVVVNVELADARDRRILWTDAFERALDDTLTMLDPVVERVVAAIAEEIEARESQRALLKPPGSLDAWEAYHRGLFHMYKFNGPDNGHAEQFFRASLALDPSFARAHAGLSFTHFQNAFLDLVPDRERQIELAFETAARAVSIDAHDPATHWGLGRALWLRGEQTEALAELAASVELCPNFALGHYTLGFVHSQTGDPKAAIEATDHSRELSPFDPLQFAMLASRAMAHVRLGEYEAAAHWAVKATVRPNAHAHILAIAAASLALANRQSEARAFVARIRRQRPDYSVDDFLRAFRFDPDTARLFRRSARSFDFGT